jgi:two-component system, NtrC family, response regulator
VVRAATFPARRSQPSYDPNHQDIAHERRSAGPVRNQPECTMMAKPKLLIVADDPQLSAQYRWAFPDTDILIAQDRFRAVSLMKRENLPVVLLDLGLPPDEAGTSEGFAILEEALRLSPDTKVIVATGHSTRSVALKAIALGAHDVCEKPVDIDMLRTIVGRCRTLHALEAENRRLSASAPRSPIDRIVTSDPTMLRICRDVEKLSAVNVPVLLLGESGTGKEALAEALHSRGPRAKHRFVPINCGAIPENLLESELFGHERGAFTGAIKQSIGKIENADLGTLFLDEIGDLPHPLQVKLLRFLENQIIERVGGRRHIQVNVRIISATNADLDAKVSEGTFRGDLLYRMNAVTVRIPPLRERGDDVMLLANFFLGKFNNEFGRHVRGFTDAAVSALTQHRWPGNVRELSNRLKRAVLMCDGRTIGPGDLDFAMETQPLPDLDLRAARLRAEREVLQIALARSNHTLAVAARLLGVSRPTLYGLMEAHSLDLARADCLEMARGSTNSDTAH